MELNHADERLSNHAHAFLNQFIVFHCASRAAGECIIVFSYAPPCSINGSCRIVLGNKTVEDHNGCSKQQNAKLARRYRFAIYEPCMQDNNTRYTDFQNSLCYSEIHVVIPQFTFAFTRFCLNLVHPRICHANKSSSQAYIPFKSQIHILHFTLVIVFTLSLEDALATVAQRLMMVVASMFWEALRSISLTRLKHHHYPATQCLLLYVSSEA